MDISKLRGEIAEKYGSQKRFAEAINWAECKVSYVMSGRYTPSVTEAEHMAKALNLSPERTLQIFMPGLLPNSK